MEVRSGNGVGLGQVLTTGEDLVVAELWSETVGLHPHELLLRNNAGKYGLAIGAVPSKRIPETLDRITGRHVAERAQGETFQAFIKRIGKTECKKMIEEFTAVPGHRFRLRFEAWGMPAQFSGRRRAEGL